MNTELDSSVCRDFEKAIGTEWLVTNGMGGYASGTVAGVNSRKYHGLLVVAAKPPVQRYVVLSRVEDRVIVGDGTTEMEEPGEGVFDLSTNEFADLVHPQGYKRLVSFELAGPGGGPVWRYEIGSGGVLEKSITLVHGQDAVIVRYVLLPGPKGGKQLPVRLQVEPMLAGRDFHGTIQLYNRPWWTIVSGENGGREPIVMAAPECPVRLQISHNADQFHVNACWWYNFTFRVERGSGYPDREDLWTPGFLEFKLRPGVPVGFVASTQGVTWEEQEALVAAGGARRAKLARAFEGVDAKDEFLAGLSVAADQFVVYRTAGAAEGKESGAGASVIAGYPWFEDWGRDAFISLCGLTLVTGRHDVARAVLATFADHMRRGLLPNRFPDKSFTPDYNTVDASLWFVHAAYQYWRYSGDVAFLTKYLYPKLCEVMECYRDGTDFGIRMDASGLIRAGDGNHQPTWMDAKIGDWVITPRHGKPVEINALWYSNLRVMALVAREAKDEVRAKGFAELAERLGGGSGGGVYERVYFNPRTECLYDVVGDDGGQDASIRPNQLLAVALPFSPLTPATQKMVVKACQRYLLTPMGMRTLAPPPPPGSGAYQGHCAGDQRSRDIAYHQGTVWPWLMGPFVTAYVKACVVGGNVGQARREARQFLEPLRGHLFQAGGGALGSISEIADGDAPHAPRGCPAQAWSVGEVLRAYYEDVLGKAPLWPHEKA